MIFDSDLRSKFQDHRNSLYLKLTHFSPVSHFYTPWKRQKTKVFLKFSGGIEMWHWTKLGYDIILNRIISAEYTFFSIVTHFIIAYHTSLVKVHSNYCNNNILILDVEQLNKIMKLYYFHTLNVLWDGQGKIEMYYRMCRVK